VTDTTHRPRIVNLLARLSVYLLPFTYAGAGFAVAQQCTAPEPAKTPDLAPTPAPGNTYVEVSAQLHEWQPKAVEWLQTAADQWCEAGLACAIVYLEGEARPKGRIIRAVLAFSDLDGASATADASENWLQIYKGADWVMPDDSRCDGPQVFRGGSRIDRTLGHELGHALGMRHVCTLHEDPNLPACTDAHKLSIMYPQGNSCFYGNVSTEGQP
jgi:hypothetical protein